METEPSRQLSLGARIVLGRTIARAYFTDGESAANKIISAKRERLDVDRATDPQNGPVAYLLDKFYNLQTRIIER